MGSAGLTNAQNMLSVWLSRVHSGVCVLFMVNVQCLVTCTIYDYSVFSVWPLTRDSPSESPRAATNARPFRDTRSGSPDQNTANTACKYFARFKQLPRKFCLLIQKHEHWFTSTSQSPKSFIQAQSSPKSPKVKANGPSFGLVTKILWTNHPPYNCYKVWVGVQGSGFSPESVRKVSQVIPGIRVDSKRWDIRL